MVSCDTMTPWELHCDGDEIETLPSQGQVDATLDNASSSELSLRAPPETWPLSSASKTVAFSRHALLSWTDTLPLATAETCVEPLLLPKVSPTNPAADNS